MNNGALPLVRATLESTILALKRFYRIAGDMAIYGELHAVLGQLSPRLLNQTYDEQMQKQMAHIGFQGRGCEDGVN